MAITVNPQTTTTGNDVFQSTSFNVPRPTGISVGDLIVIVGTLAGTETNDATMSGFTAFNLTAGFSDKFAFWKIATSGDTSAGNWTITCDDGFIEQWAIAVWSGVDTASPFATGPSVNISASTTYSFTSQTSPGAGSVWVGLLAIANNSVSMTQPSGPTNQAQSTSGFYFGPGCIYSAQVDSGSYAPSGTINSGFEWASVAFFLNPASGGGAITLVNSNFLMFMGPQPQQ
jgi:hypothetical protein